VQFLRVHSILGNEFFEAYSPIPDDIPIPDSFRKYLIIAPEQAIYERGLAQEEQARRARVKERASQSRRRRNQSRKLTPAEVVARERAGLDHPEPRGRGGV
jgi:hypothetical protein